MLKIKHHLKCLDDWVPKFLAPWHSRTFVNICDIEKHGRIQEVSQYTLMLLILLRVGFNYKNISLFYRNSYPNYTDYSAMLFYIFSLLLTVLKT